MHYYNEFDPKAAHHLRSLIKAGLIPDGVVDEKSITEVRAADLVGYVQCHFFAGIGGWPEALRLAGWPVDRHVWTGSCPCQPFSSAGKQKGNADERHLWPVFFRLLQEYNAISQREAVPVFGEQVSSAIGHGWLDGVCADLEGEGYAVGSCVLGAHSVSAPHKRQRLYWVGYPNWDGRTKGWPTPKAARYRSTAEPAGDTGPGPSSGRLGNTEHNGSSATAIGRGIAESGDFREERQDVPSEPAGAGGREESGDLCSGRLGNSDIKGLEGRVERGGSSNQLAARAAMPSDFWSDYYLAYCRDGKARRIKSGVCVLADGVPGRVAQLRGLGNAIVPQVAAEFIKAFMHLSTGE